MLALACVLALSIVQVAFAGVSPPETNLGEADNRIHAPAFVPPGHDASPAIAIDVAGRLYVDGSREVTSHLSFLPTHMSGLHRYRI